MSIKGRPPIWFYFDKSGEGYYAYDKNRIPICVISSYFYSHHNGEMRLILDGGGWCYGEEWKGEWVAAVGWDVIPKLVNRLEHLGIHLRDGDWTESEARASLESQLERWRVDDMNVGRP